MFGTPPDFMVFLNIDKYSTVIGKNCTFASIAYLYVLRNCNVTQTQRTHRLRVMTFVSGKRELKKDGVSPFGKAFVTSVAPQQAGVVGTVDTAYADIFRTAPVELEVMFIRTAKLIEVIRNNRSTIHVIEKAIERKNVTVHCFPASKIPKL